MKGPVLVLGATGYVGGRLVPLLLERGYSVHASGRSLEKLSARPWADRPEVRLVEANALDYRSLAAACRGCTAAFYLVHSMDPYNRDFARTDRYAAGNMVAAADSAGLERIIYLGGLAPEGQPLSRHLTSRDEVARILQTGPVPTTVFRAPMILGSGSASFEIMRYLVDRLPVMPAPRQVDNLTQPICIRNVLGYLAGCLEHPETVGGDYQACGPEVISYRDLFRAYAEEAGLGRRVIVPLRGLTPRVCSYLIHLVTPVHQSLARPLAIGLQNTVVCTDDALNSIMPQDLMTVRETIRRVLEKEERHSVETRWSDAGASRPYEWAQTGDPSYAGGATIDAGYHVRLDADPETVWRPLTRIGGKNGWYFADFLWQLRGWLDNLVGGVGIKRGRPHPERLTPGDALDFWRVVRVDPPRRLLLMSEMRVPGEMVLDFHINPHAEGGIEFKLFGRFLPKGLAGLAYYYALLPFHTWLYKGLLTALVMETRAPVIDGPRRINNNKTTTGGDQ